MATTAAMHVSLSSPFRRSVALLPHQYYFPSLPFLVQFSRKKHCFYLQRNSTASTSIFYLFYCVYFAETSVYACFVRLSLSLSFPPCLAAGFFF